MSDCLTHSAAEDGGTDAHHGRALLNGQLEVIRHAHRQHVERQAGGDTKPVAQLDQLPEAAAQARFIRPRLRNAHQARQLDPWQHSHGLRQRRKIAGRDTALALLTAHIDLQADPQWRQVHVTLLGQALSNFQPVYRVHPGEMVRDEARLVALDRADKVPLEWQITQLGNLVDGFLDIVFTKRDLPGSMRFAHCISRPGLGNRKQPHRIVVPSAFPPGGFDACADCAQVFSYAGHIIDSTYPPEWSKSITAASRGPIPNPESEELMEITELLAFSVKNKASDLHLSAGLPPMIRVNGDVRRINLPPLEHKDVHAMVYDIMNDGQRKQYEEFLECDFSFAVPNLARFRVNAFVQERGAGAVFRTIPSKVLSLEDLNCPKVFKDISEQPRGIVLVTGPTGSGKSTTLAAMIDYINENEYGHILTIEDPIEFVHTPKRCLINQREVHRDTHSFSNALRSALREDPDIVLVGELRDLETIRLAMTAAETGHLVFGTLHTSSAAKTVDRVVDVFPAEEKEMIRAMLSESLRAVISQTLLKTKDGQGRVAAHEIMIGTPAIRNLIRENKVAQMYSSIQTGQQYGMQTLDQNLQDLVRRNIVSPGEARIRAANKDLFPGN